MNPMAPPFFCCNYDLSFWLSYQKINFTLSLNKSVFNGVKTKIDSSWEHQSFQNKRPIYLVKISWVNNFLFCNRNWWKKMIIKPHISNQEKIFVYNERERKKKLNDTNLIHVSSCVTFSILKSLFLISANHFRLSCFQIFSKPFSNDSLLNLALEDWTNLKSGSVWARVAAGLAVFGNIASSSPLALAKNNPHQLWI